MNRFVPIILLLGIIFNSACVILFKIKSERRVSQQYENLSASLNLQVQEFSRDALHSIDLYFLSNSVYQSSSKSLITTNSTSQHSPIYEVVGDWDYIFWTFGGRSFARVVSNNLSKDYQIGDKFPRGGVITSIEPDGVCLNDFFWINNVRSLVNSKSSTSSNLSLSSNSYLKNQRSFSSQ